MPISFVEKIWEAFAVQKLLSFFQQKISVYFGYIDLKHLTSWLLNELVNVTKLWTTGPRAGAENPYNMTQKFIKAGSFNNLLQISKEYLSIHIQVWDNLYLYIKIFRILCQVEQELTHIRRNIFIVRAAFVNFETSEKIHSMNIFIFYMKSTGVEAEKSKLSLLS